MFQNDNVIIINKISKTENNNIVTENIISYLHTFFIIRCILNTRLIEEIKITVLALILKHGYRHHCYSPRAYLSTRIERCKNQRDSCVYGYGHL